MPDFEFVKDMDVLYAKYSPILSTKTQSEKEEYLISLVESGEITADQALVIAIKEQINLSA